jgi:hypothetical protein
VRNATHAGGRRGQAAQDCSILDCRMYENGPRGLCSSSARRARGSRTTASRANADAGIVLTATDETTIVNTSSTRNGGDGLLLATPSSALTAEFNTLCPQRRALQVHESSAGGTGTIAKQT